jgi:hypothetical protein
MKKTSLSDIQKALTMGGAIPRGYAFLCEGQIYTWNPRSHFSVHLIEDNALAQSCRDYLAAESKRFETLEDAKNHIIAEKWLAWEKLLGPYDPE